MRFTAKASGNATLPTISPPAYPEPVDGVFNIGVLHTGMGGMGGHANYAPCTLDDLVTKGYDYWALGHVHHGAVLHRIPMWFSPETFRDGISAKQAPRAHISSLLKIAKSSNLGLLHTDVVRWAHLQVSVDGCDRNAEALERVRQAVEQAIDAGADGRLLACRIELTGRTEIHDHLLISTEHLLAEARAAALGIRRRRGMDRARCRRYGTSARPGGACRRVRMRWGNFTACWEMPLPIPNCSAQLEADVGELVRKLPSDVRNEIEDAALKAAVQADYPALITHVRGYLNARLTAQED